MIDMRLALAAPLLLLAACSDDPPPVDKRASEAKQLVAGGYAVEGKVESMVKTDYGAPAIKAKPGDLVKAGAVLPPMARPTPACSSTPAISAGRRKAMPAARSSTSSIIARARARRGRSTIRSRAILPPMPLPRRSPKEPASPPPTTIS